MTIETNPFLARSPEGLLFDIRATFARGDRVLVLGGLRGGITGTVEQFVAELTTNGYNVTEHGYRVVLDDGQMVSVKWDEVEAPRPHSQP